MADVLIVEDITLVRGAIKAVLAKAGHSVFEAANGEAAIALLQRRGFDLVVTDMIMPRQGGGDVMRFLESRGNRTPILAISGGTADVPAEEVLQTARGQADAVMAKPFDNRELVATVAALLGRGGRRLAP